MCDHTTQTKTKKKLCPVFLPLSSYNFRANLLHYTLHIAHYGQLLVRTAAIDSNAAGGFWEERENGTGSGAVESMESKLEQLPNIASVEVCIGRNVFGVQADTVVVNPLCYQEENGGV